MKRGGFKQKAFLAAFRETASITKAADASKAHRRSHYKWLADDPDYAAAFERAKIEAGQTLEDEAIRRAHEGVLTPVFYKGKPTGAVREYSDQLLMFLLRGFIPEKYKDRVTAEVGGLNGGPIVLEDKRLSALDDQELTQLVELARKIQPE